MESEVLRVLVFDYAAEECAYTAKIVREYFAGRDTPAEVREFSENDPCVYDFEGRQKAGTPYHIAFMGADTMRDMEVARHIRSMDQQIPLFLVSEAGDMALEGFRLRALDYLTKPVSANMVGEAVQRIAMNCTNTGQNAPNKKEETSI